jgi:uncharacterized protein YdhG (YjbR/CyaY superfamily)
MKEEQKTTRTAAAKDKRYEGFTDEERAAMQDRVREQKTSSRRGARADELDEESAVLEKIAEMPAPDRAMAERLHAIVKASAPDVAPRLWYGQPAYARGGKTICFFQPRSKFKTRYATLGFSDSARLDEGSMWPTSYALMELTAEDEARIGAIVKRAMS